MACNKKCCPFTDSERAACWLTTRRVRMKNKDLTCNCICTGSLCAMLLNFLSHHWLQCLCFDLGIVLNELVDLPRWPGLNWSDEIIAVFDYLHMGFLSLPIATVASTGLSSLKISLLLAITVALQRWSWKSSIWNLTYRTVIWIQERLFVVDLLSQQLRSVETEERRRELPYLYQPSFSSTFWLSLS